MTTEVGALNYSPDFESKSCRRIIQSIPNNHDEWVEKEGGIENPTHDKTIAEECQQKRIKWLCENVVGNRILELGCNWGYILDAVCKYSKASFGLGIDINLTNINKALRNFPDRYFIVRDITDPFRMQVFKDNSFNTVMLPDVLEHLTKGGVKFVISEALRIASDKVLITLPLEENKKHCFKHKWIVEEEEVYKIADVMRPECWAVSVSNDSDFYYIIGDLRKFYYTTKEANEEAQIISNGR